MRKCKECKWFIDGKCMLVSEIKEAKTIFKKYNLKAGKMLINPSTIKCKRFRRYL